MKRSERSQPGPVGVGSVISEKFRIIEEREPCGQDERCFKALHLGTGRRVELRLLPDGVSRESPEAERLLRAARAVGRAAHANLLNVVDSGLDAEGRPYVVYEQFAGVPCTELIDHRGPCDLPLASDIMVQVLDALRALHLRGLFHRQLRADVVLVDGSGEDMRVKLVGLGYAGMAGREAEAPELPRGFSRYLAPEARRGDASCAPTTDLYAAGVLFRYLLTGDTGPGASLPPQIAQAIARATADDPDERFQTADQLRTCVTAIGIPSTRESLVPSGSLLSDLRFILRRRAALEAENGARQLPDGKLALFSVLLIVESLYAHVGANGWRTLLREVPEIEQLLPAAGLGERLRDEGVSAALVARMLRVADTHCGKGNLRLVVELGEALARRGLGRFCAALPEQLTPDVLTACVPVLWRSIARGGEAAQIDHRSGGARMSVRALGGASLELTVLFASLLRGQLAALSRRGEVNLVAAQALDDGADILVLSW